MHCPECHSLNIRRSRRQGIVPLWLVFPRARCLSCGHLFRVSAWTKIPTADPYSSRRRRAKKLAAAKEQSSSSHSVTKSDITGDRSIEAT